MRSRWWTLVAVLLAAETGLAGCGGSGGPPYDVTTTVVSGVGTRDITVWQPDGDESWPVVYAVPGSGGSAPRDFDVFAAELASHGVVVFGTDFMNSDDIECGYQHVMGTAGEFDGDLTRPVTMFGYSEGATEVLWHGLSEASYGPDSNLIVGCPLTAERPHIIVSLNGCHLTNSQIDGRIGFWDNEDAVITLISGTNDAVCGTRHSEAALASLTNGGYETSYVEIPDANHWEVIFHDMAYGIYETLEPDDRAGQATVQAVLDAIGIDRDVEEP